MTLRPASQGARRRAKSGNHSTDSRDILLRRKRYFLRPLHDGDESILQAFFYSHTPETVRLRYGYAVRQMTFERAHQLVTVDGHRAVALGLFSLQQGRETLHAVARYAKENEHLAEVAFVVRETKRRSGMATLLLRELTRIAAANEVVAFRAQVLRENYPMRRFLENFQPSVRESDGGAELEYFLDLGVLRRALGYAA